MKKTASIIVLMVCVFLSSCGKNAKVIQKITSAVQSVYSSSELSDSELELLVAGEDVPINNRYYYLSRSQFMDFRENIGASSTETPSGIDGFWSCTIEEGNISRYSEGGAYSIVIQCMDYSSNSKAKDCFDDAHDPDYMTDVNCIAEHNYEDDSVKSYYKIYTGGGADLVYCRIVQLDGDTVTTITLRCSDDMFDVVRDEFLELCDSLSINDPFPTD